MRCRWPSTIISGVIRLHAEIIERTRAHAATAVASEIESIVIASTHHIILLLLLLWPLVVVVHHAGAHVIRL